MSWIFEKWNDLQKVFRILYYSKRIQEARKNFPGLKEKDPLRKWLLTYIIDLKELATLTSSDIDDKAIVKLESIVNDDTRWDALFTLVQAIIEEKAASDEKAIEYLADIEEETGNPLLVLGIISIVLQIVVSIRQLRKDKDKSQGRVRIFRRLKNAIDHNKQIGAGRETMD